jgi:hypothetical protein
LSKGEQAALAESVMASRLKVIQTVVIRPRGRRKNGRFIITLQGQKIF